MDAIQKAVEGEMKLFVEAEYEKVKKTFLEELEKGKAKALAGIALHLMQSVRMETFGSEIIIKLEKPKQ